MNKIKAWHKALIALVLALLSIGIFGLTTLNTALIVLYATLLPVSYFLEKKTKLSLWQERIIIALIIYPLLYLYLRSYDFLYFLLASLLFSAILLLSEKWKDTEKEILPEWEGEESEEGKNEIKETSPK
jgi:hypothetical protein